MLSGATPAAQHVPALTPQSLSIVQGAETAATLSGRKPVAQQAVQQSAPQGAGTSHAGAGHGECLGCTGSAGAAEIELQGIEFPGEAPDIRIDIGHSTVPSAGWGARDPAADDASFAQGQENEQTPLLHP
ncbi:hypothetical protein WJX84_008722 [Apatococcus fuscideae]|uniref:Uncharacterized protein n=1 Tax=Apatococcus fuscideae TaxID=2026836 RepID=A0AAW1SN45_9CHLO